MEDIITWNIFLVFFNQTLSLYVVTCAGEWKYYKQGLLTGKGVTTWKGQVLPERLILPKHHICVTEGRRGRIGVKFIKGTKHWFSPQLINRDWKIYIVLVYKFNGIYNKTE